MTILGMSGFCGSGKSTAANHLVTFHGFNQVALADKVRELSLNINPYVYAANQFLSELVEDKGWDSAKREFMEVREFMQSVGNGARETFGDMFWIDQAFTPEVLAYDKIVVSDVRYMNEVEYITAMGGFIVRTDRGDIGPVNDHISEQLLPFDFVVQNQKGYLPGFYNSLNELIRNITKLTE